MISKRKLTKINSSKFTDNSFKHQTFVCTLLNYQKVIFQTIYHKVVVGWLFNAKSIFMQIVLFQIIHFSIRLLWVGCVGFMTYQPLWVINAKSILCK